MSLAGRPQRKLWHGGVAGLTPGSILLPSPPHVTDGCPICVARAAGRSVTVGEFRDWLRALSTPAAVALAAGLRNEPSAEIIDPPTQQAAVYVTTDRDYATWYAARSKGDLYEVEPIGELAPSAEDLFPTFTCDSARVVAVARRGVRLSQRERRRIAARWPERSAA